MPRKDVDMSDKLEPSQTKGGRLAKRARSFKEDLLEKFTQMRTPSSARSTSPSKASPRAKHKHELTARTSNGTAGDSGGRKNEKDVHQLQKEVQVALQYFQDVVNKEKLEMLPGSATIVLENVLAVNNMLKNCLTNEQSSLLMSTMNQVYQSLANLVRWADNILLHGDCSQNKENVSEIVQDVQEAIKTLVQLAVDKIQSKEMKLGGIQNGVYTTKLDSPKRTSLPDIPLTPREREILEQTSFSALDDSSIQIMSTPSSDSLLHNGQDDVDNSIVPPPKPPLPSNWDGAPWMVTRCSSAGSNECNDSIPPLPPKRRVNVSGVADGGLPIPVPTGLHAPSNSWNGNVSPLSSSPHTHSSGFRDASVLRTNSAEWASPISVTPDSASPLSASASSLDSVLNRSSDDLLGTGGTGCSSRRVSNSKQNSSHFHSSSSYSYEFSSSFSSSSRTASWKGPAANQCPASTTSVEEFDQLHAKLQELSCQTKTVPSKTNSLTDGSVLNTTVSSSCMSHQSASHSSNTVAAAAAVLQASSFNHSETVATQGLNESGWASSSMESSSSCAMEAAIRSLGPPPAIPPKKRTVPPPLRTRTPSQYDNVPDPVLDENSEDHAAVDRSSSLRSPRMRRIHSESAHSFCVNHSEFHQVVRTESSMDGPPPPLPPKRKNIMAYMQMFGDYSEPNTTEFLRHSLHTYNLLRAQWHQQREMTMPLRHAHHGSGQLSSSDESSVFSDTLSLISSELVAGLDEEVAVTPAPPALPPKRNRASIGGVKVRPYTSPTNPNLPIYDLKEKSFSMMEGSNGFSDKEQCRPSSTQPSTHFDLVRADGSKRMEAEESLLETSALDELDVDDYLIHKKPGEESPDIRGGAIDSLIVRATKVSKNDFMYQEAFLTTYRTFISPLELLIKLLYRYDKFSIMSDVMRQRAARNAFSLLVRVVDDLCVSDIDKDTMHMLMEFVFQLLCSGDLILARALRSKVLEKCNAKKRATSNNVVLLSSYGVTTRQATLPDFKSEHLAEQMTLLDAVLFQKIEIPEVLIWAREQSEELSPNLTTFTEHFNKMSYWARSRILEQSDAKDRERYVVKFIKIMKHLRKLNNFNSYLAILSALDSAPIRRLEWQRHITEGLKEYCELIDSSSSFRAYRQALAETEPPCIPYIGLILQDLTFVHIGNSDLLSEPDIINFSKRWQQFNILDNMRRFKKCNYNFKRNDKVIAFFNNFDDYLCEEAMWQISESIKPRGGKKKVEPT